MRRPAVLLALLTLGTLLPAPTGAQVPIAGVTAVDDLVLVSLDVPTLPQDVPLLGQAQYEIIVQDLSGDNPQNRTEIFHTIRLEVEINTTSRAGWNVLLGPNYFSPSNGGDTWRSFATVQALPTIKQPFLQFTVRAILQSSLGPTRVDEETVIARVRPFALMNADFRTAPPRLGPFEEATIPIHIENAGVYPDTYEITATGPAGWLVRAQSRATLFPGEERDIMIQVQTPATRVFVPQEAGVVNVRVRSTTDPGVFVERATIVNLEGFYLPDYWVPVLVLGAVLAGTTTTRVRETRRRRAKEQGQPVDAGFTPAQAVLLGDLKQRDPARHRALVRAQRQAFRRRVRAWASVRTRRGNIERTMVDRQHQAARETRAEERARLREDRAKARTLAMQRAELEREKTQRLKVIEAQRKREEDRARREALRIVRAEAPNRRREERARRLRERKLRAELARKQRLLREEERKLRIAKEKRRRELERKRRTLERRVQRKPKARSRRKGPPGGDPGGEGGSSGQGGQPDQP